MTNAEKARRRLARRIARDLFTNGLGRRVDRLAMMIGLEGGAERMLGGWSERAVADRVADVLRRAYIYDRATS